MADKKKNKDHSRSLQRQHDLFMDTIVRMAGRSLEQALKDTFFRKRFMINNQLKYYVSMEDNPIAEMMIQRLENEKAMLDIEEYQTMLNKTHEAVKKEAMKATEEGVEEALRELQKSLK